MTAAEKTGKKQRGKPFPRGMSGNPSGRPRGARNRVTMALERLLDGEGEEITRTAIKKAKDGDSVALKLCLDRLIAVRRDRAVKFSMPPLHSASDAAEAMGAVTAAVAAGELTCAEAADLARLVESFSKAIEVADLEQRLAALEQGASGQGVAGNHAANLAERA